MRTVKAYLTTATRLALGLAMLGLAQQASALTAQTITSFAPATPITYSTGETFTLTAKGGASGNAVTFASTTASICTVSASKVTVLAVGTCKLTANQAGNSKYSAAPQVSASVVVNAASQAITSFAPATPISYGTGETFTLTAKGGASGNVVTFASTTTSICTVSGSTATVLGIGTCKLTANQAGNSNYSAAAQVSASVVINAASQTITSFAPATPISYGTGETFTLTAKGGASGNAVTFASTTTSICTVSGSTATVLGIGTCKLTANQAGNSNYSAAAQVSASVVINKESQTITFAPLSGKILGMAPFTVTATSSAGLTPTFATSTTQVCKVSVSTVTMVGAGTCTITASQGGTANISAASSVSQSFAVASDVLPTVMLTSPSANQSVTAPASITLTATATSTDATIARVQFFNGSTLIGTATQAPYSASWTNVPAGTYQVSASATDSLGGVSSTAPITINVINKQNQTLTFAPLSDKILGMAPFTVTATSSAGLTPTFATSTTQVCKVAVSTVTLVGLGTCTITASQDGNTNTNAASSVSQSFAVTADVLPTVTLTSPSANQSVTAPGNFTLTATATSTDATIARVQFFNGSTLIGTATQAPYSASWTNVPAGTYQVSASATDSLGGVSSTAPVTVNVINNPITVGISSPANGTNLTAPAKLTITATASDSGGTITQVNFFNGSSLMGTVTQAPYSISFPDAEPGTYQITAQATDSAGYGATSAVTTVTVVPQGGTGTGTGGGTEQVYYVQSDQLNTPRMITDSSGNAVWQWDNSEVFGNNLPNQDPNGTGNKFVFNPRFAGQYFDVETGTHYNYFRDYDPNIGRYIESDPIGLRGGINTYSYVGGNSLMWRDPLGLIIIPMGSPAQVSAINNALSTGKAQSDTAAGLIRDLQSDSTVVFVTVGTGNFYDSANWTAQWDPNKQHLYDGSDPSDWRPSWVG